MGATAETTPQKKWAWPKSSDWPDRLNTTATFACLWDTAIAVAADVSDQASNFIADGTPALVNGVFEIATFIVPFVPNLINLCRKEKVGDIEDNDVHVDEKASEALFKLMEVELDSMEKGLQDKLKPAIADIRGLQQKMLAARKEAEKSDEFGPYDNIINFLYLTTRAVDGVLVVNRLCNDSSTDDSSQISHWMSLVSNVAYLGYLCSNLLPKLYKHHKGHEESQNPEGLKLKPSARMHTFFKPDERVINRESRSETLRAPLLEGAF